MLSVPNPHSADLGSSLSDALALEPWPAGAGARATRLIGRRDLARRTLNVIMALLGLVLLSPLMLVIAVAIRLSSPGPVLFRQVRVGLDRRSPIPEPANWRRRIDYGGRLFTMYKFRTMHHGQESGLQVWARPDDPRVFPVGRWLRKYRLDELPQLFNVLLGDMNIVGPRPEQPEISLDLRATISRYPHRQRVLPGITGLAQISHHYDTCLDDVRRKVAYDLEYIRKQSALEDLRIMLQTVPAVVLKRNGW